MHALSGPKLQGNDLAKFHFLTKIMKFHDFGIGSAAVGLQPLAPLRVPARLRRSLGVAQAAPEGRSDRFRVRTHALSGPEHQGNDLGKFHFLVRNHEIS